MRYTNEKIDHMYHGLDLDLLRDFDVDAFLDRVAEPLVHALKEDERQRKIADARYAIMYAERGKDQTKAIEHLRSQGVDDEEIMDLIERGEKYARERKNSAKRSYIRALVTSDNLLVGREYSIEYSRREMVEEWGEAATVEVAKQTQNREFAVEFIKEAIAKHWEYYDEDRLVDQWEQSQPARAEYLSRFAEVGS